MAQRIFLDTSCLIAAIHSQNDRHHSCFELLQSVASGKRVGGIAMHSIAEFFAVVTRLPGKLRVSPDEAYKLINSSIIVNFETIELTTADYVETLKGLADANLAGGLVYDALILRCAEKGRFDTIYTLNLRHFQIIPSSITSKIREP